MKKEYLVIKRPYPPALHVSGAATVCLCEKIGSEFTEVVSRFIPRSLPPDANTEKMIGDLVKGLEGLAKKLNGRMWGKNRKALLARLEEERKNTYKLLATG